MTVKIRKFPYPFRAALAVNNDTDGMTWEAFEDWHAFVNGSGATRYGDGLGLEISDSFWVWSSRGEFALQHCAPWADGRADAPELERIKELVAAGFLDTLHGFGDWKDRYQLTQDDLKRGFDLLDSLGVFPSIYVNHGGGQLHGHNIGGPWASYQGGDNPDHPSYCLPHLLERGARYFWVDALYENQKFGEELEFDSLDDEAHFFKDYRFDRWSLVSNPARREDEKTDILSGQRPTAAYRQKKFLANRVLTPLVGQDGSAFFGVKRFRGVEGPTAANFALQASSTNLDLLEARRGACVVYQHFGVWRAIGREKRHKSQISGRAQTLDESAVWAWRDIAERNAAGRLFVTTTSRLLDFLHMRDALNIDVARSQEKVVITIKDIDCPVYGAQKPTLEKLNGLAFEVDRDAPEVVAAFEGRTSPLPMQRVADPHNDRVDIVYLPWSGASFPAPRKKPTGSSPPLKEPPTPENTTPIAIDVTPQDRETLMKKWIGLSEGWDKLTGESSNSKAAGAPIKPDLQKIHREWNDIHFPPQFADAGKYGQGMLKRPLSYYIQRISSLTQGGGAALDAGCGVGAWTIALAEKFDRVTGIDINRQRLDAGRWLLREYGIDRAQISFGDITNITQPDDAFDFAFCYSVVISYLSMSAVLRELARVVRPGGAIYMCVNGPGWLYHQRDEKSKQSATARIQGLRGLYNSYCQQLRPGVVNAFSEAIAAYYAQPAVKAALAAKCNVDAAVIDEFITANYFHNNFEDVFWPTALNINSPQDYVAILDDFLSVAAGHALSLKDAAADIQQRCGAPFVSLFASDLFQLSSGRKTDFSHSRAGRSYEPEEVEAIVAECGLTGFAWAPEGQLTATGATEDAALKPIYPGEFDGKLNVWEFICYAPN